MPQLRRALCSYISRAVPQEDHWDTGDMHFQFWPCDGSDGTYCSGQQGMLIHAVNGNTMQPNQWGHSQVECKIVILSRFVCCPAR